MSGVNSSKLRWTSWRVRALLAVFLVAAMMIPAISAYAQDAPALVQPSGVLCVEGTVIDFDETLLPTAEPNDPVEDLDRGGDPIQDEEAGGPYRWQVVASFQGTPVFTQIVNKKARFKFDEFAREDIGEWTFQLRLPEFYGGGSPADRGYVGIAPEGTDFQLTVDLRYGLRDCIEIRYKIKRPVPVLVLKIDDLHTPLKGWTIKANPAKGNWFALPDDEETGDDGFAEFLLTEGKWIFTEKAPEDTEFRPIIPKSGKQDLDVKCNLVPTDTKVVYECEPYVLRFKNLITEGCIDVVKEDVFYDPEYGETNFPLAGWEIKVKRADGEVIREDHTDAQGRVTFDELALGPYVVVEELQGGWDTAPDYPKSFDVIVTGSKKCTQVLFRNEQRPGFCIEGYKIDTNGKIGLPNWKIKLEPEDKGGYPNRSIDGFEKLVTTTNAEGYYRFDLPANDYRIPGATYEICEDEVEGWLPHTRTCQEVKVPKKMGACAKAKDFENQQVGHAESDRKHDSDHDGEGCQDKHTVAPGESLYGIGAAYGVPPRKMMAANRWVYNRPYYYVYSGDSVCIP